MVRRHAIPALAALILGAGCHAGTSGSLKRSEPSVAKETISKTRIVAKLNKNAAAIRSLQAFPSIAAKEAEGRSVGLRGMMAMDRPKDFRLEIALHGRSVADIGSNDQGFWFWVKDSEKKEQAIYVCDYEHIDASPLAVTMQPEWIMEAMGLREIPARDAATMNVEKGDKAGQLVLTQLRNDDAKRPYTKLTIVDEQTGEIKEHQIYSGAKKELLARATITETQHIKMEPTDDDPSGTVVDFPSKMQIEWIVERFSLDITMAQLKINPRFSPEKRLAIFTEPIISNAKKQNLALLGNPQAPGGSWMYESSPRSGSVRLGKPEAEPIGVDGATRPAGNQQPLDVESSNLPAQPSAYVGPQVPRGVDPEAVPVQASSNRRGWGPIRGQ